jgi:hypothetical protein
MGRISWKRRWLVALAIVMVASVVTLGLLPTIACRSGWVERLLNRALVQRRLRATIGEADVGWFTALSMHQVDVRDDAASWELSAEHVRGNLSLWQLLWAGRDLGTFVIENPTLIVAMDRPFHLPPPSSTPLQVKRLAVSLRGGTILVRETQTAEPELFAEQIDVDATWTASAQGKALTVEPGLPLQRVQLTRAMCDHGLNYVAPIVSNAAWTSGSLSLELDECQLHLSQIEQSRMRGRVSLHSVETGLRSPVARTIARMVARVTGRQLPESVRIADESIVEFSLDDGRVSHSGLAFGLPEISTDLQIRTHGSVGLDKQLDLVADIPLPLQLLRDGPIAQALGTQTIHLPIRGTLDQPVIKAEGDGQLVSEILSRLVNPALEGGANLNEAVDAVRQWRAEARQRRSEGRRLLPRLRDRFRDARERAPDE